MSILACPSGDDSSSSCTLLRSRKNLSSLDRTAVVVVADVAFAAATTAAVIDAVWVLVCVFVVVDVLWFDAAAVVDSSSFIVEILWCVWWPWCCCDLDCDWLWVLEDDDDGWLKSPLFIRIFNINIRYLYYITNNIQT